MNVASVYPKNPQYPNNARLYPQYQQYVNANPGACNVQAQQSGNPGGVSSLWSRLKFGALLAGVAVAVGLLFLNPDGLTGVRNAVSQAVSNPMQALNNLASVPVNLFNSLVAKFNPFGKAV